MSADHLKTFPVSEIRPLNAAFGGSLAFNPYGDLPPTLWYSLGIDLHPIELGDNAPAANVWGTTVDTDLRLGGIVLPFRDWREIDGSWGPVEDVGESSVYVSQVHNPIDILSVRFTRLRDATFKIDLTLLIAFEFEGAGFCDTQCSLSVEAKFAGLSFCVPIWNDPASVKFPPAWKIPDDYSVASVTELFERFVDTRLYTLELKDRTYSLKPKSGE